MIDFYIEIRRMNHGEIHGKPSALLDYYHKYIHVEKESRWEQLYFYTNSFNEQEHGASFIENDKHLFILLGTVFYRNHVQVSSRPGPLNTSEVYGIIFREPNPGKIIKGDYAYILFNKKDSSIEICNSPFGVIPLQYAHERGSVFISSNLTMILKALDKKTIDKAALVQVSMFDTILGNNTLIKEIRQIQFGQKVAISAAGKISENQYYFHTDLMSGIPMARNEAIDEIVDTLRKNAALLPTTQPFLLGLTGGYDCRLNFSLIPEALYDNIIAYTYGMATSPEFRIASKIAEKYRLRHEKIFLDGDFEREYVANADEVVKLGDGFTPFMRVNYLYSHRLLSAHARECVTGMFGSEFIKPMHVMADSVSLNQATVASFMSPGVSDSIAGYFHRLKSSPESYFREEVYSEDVLAETIDLIGRRYLLGKESLKAEHKLFNFYMNEGMRKFFMELIRIDRMFINHHLPFLDLDFIELLLKSKYAGINNNIFNESLLKRRKGQLFYVDAMERLKPQLNDIPVDRGYKPKYLKGRIGWILIGAGYFLHKRLAPSIQGNTTFNTKKWRGMVYRANHGRLSNRDPYFNDRLSEKFANGYYLSHEHVYGKHFSLKMWLNNFI